MHSITKYKYNADEGRVLLKLIDSEGRLSNLFYYL